MEKRGYTPNFDSKETLMRQLLSSILLLCLLLLPLASPRKRLSMTQCTWETTIDSKETLMRQLLSSILLLCLLLLPLVAQEETLHGTWETTIVDDETGEGDVARLTFHADGTSEWVLEVSGSLVEGITLAEEDGTEEIEVPDFLRDDLPEIRDALEVLSAAEQYRLTVHGTYRVAGDSLWVYGDVVEHTVDGESFDMTLIYRAMALFIVGLEAAFGETELSEEDFQALYEEMLAEMVAVEDEVVGELLTGTYAIEGDTMLITITDEDGVGTSVQEFHRIDAASAVVQTTWGDLKAAWRP